MPRKSWPEGRVKILSALLSATPYEITKCAMDTFLLGYSYASYHGDETVIIVSRKSNYVNTAI